MTSLSISNTGAVQTCDTMWGVWQVAVSAVQSSSGGGGGRSHCHVLLAPFTAARLIGGITTHSYHCVMPCAIYSVNCLIGMYLWTYYINSEIHLCL